VYLLGLRIGNDIGSHPNESVIGERSIIADGRVHSQKAVIPHHAVAGHDDLRGDEYMIADRCVVANVVSAPEHAVIADRNVRLNGVVFENKAVLPYV
jgi:NDP-sugar pyrophosphorylase family protein